MLIKVKECGLYIQIVFSHKFIMIRIPIVKYKAISTVDARLG